MGAIGAIPVVPSPVALLLTTHSAQLPADPEEKARADGKKETTLKEKGLQIKQAEAAFGETMRATKDYKQAKAASEAFLPGETTSPEL